MDAMSHPRMVGALLALVVALVHVPAAEAMTAVELKRSLLLLEEAERSWQAEASVEAWAAEYDVSDTFGLFGADDEGQNALRDMSRVDRRIDALLEVDLGATTLRFRDVRRDAWYAPYVRTAAERGIVQGYRDGAGPGAEYRPERPVSVEELAKVALTARGVTVPCGSQALRNRSGSGSWSVPYVTCAEILGWGLFSDGSVDVRRPATRAEVVLTMLQAFSVQAAIADAAAPPLFRDVPRSMLYAQVIERAAQDGIVGGYTNADGTPTGRFGPDDAVSRAQLAKILVLSVERYGS